jgi:hypothetical protein
MMRRHSFKLRNELQIVLIIVLLLVFRTSAAVAQKADLTMEPIANGANVGCVLITIKVTPEDSVITDVHLKNLGGRKHIAPAAPATTPAESVSTTTGDPANFRQDKDGLPEDWDGAEVGTPNPAGAFKPGTPQITEYTENWSGPQLKAAADFHLVYCGTKTLEKEDEKGKGISLTNGGKEIKSGAFPGLKAKW